MISDLPICHQQESCWVDLERIPLAFTFPLSNFPLLTASLLLSPLAINLHSSLLYLELSWISLFYKTSVTGDPPQQPFLEFSTSVMKKNFFAHSLLWLSVLPEQQEKVLLNIDQIMWIPLEILAQLPALLIIKFKNSNITCNWLHNCLFSSEIVPDIQWELLFGKKRNAHSHWMRWVTAYLFYNWKSRLVTLGSNTQLLNA